ncbi:MAG TPA: DUF1586 domain-containing protein, partial [Rhodopirellula baltica]|nr:DUF1586 domain-containing protein [Rhodopirellula baltica]
MSRTALAAVSQTPTGA